MMKEAVDFPPRAFFAIWCLSSDRLGLQVGEGLTLLDPVFSDPAEVFCSGQHLWFTSFLPELSTSGRAPLLGVFPTLEGKTGGRGTGFFPSLASLRPLSYVSCLICQTIFWFACYSEIWTFCFNTHKGCCS